MSLSYSSSLIIIFAHLKVICFVLTLFHLPYHIPGHLSGHILNQHPFHFLFIFPVIFPFLIFVIFFPETDNGPMVGLWALEVNHSLCPDIALGF